jgi:hypothetical protein
VACSRGHANPNTFVQRRLFAASGGYCQNPACNQPLFVTTKTSHTSIAEMAHIFAAEDDGPRANLALSPKERGSFENLILLCANCHTIVDKAPTDFPDEEIRQWKNVHEQRIGALFGAVSYPNREAAFAALRPLLNRTHAIFKRIGPNNDYKTNPESDEAAEWQYHMRESIIPTNRSVLTLLDHNYVLLNEQEVATVELFRQHVEGLEQRHIHHTPLPSAPQFPDGMNKLFSN